MKHSTKEKDDRYGHQGELETEIREKIKLAFRFGVGEGYDSFADSVASLLVDSSLANFHLSFEDKAELVNSRAGQYFHDLFPEDVSSLPNHLAKEIKIMRN